MSILKIKSKEFDMELSFDGNGVCEVKDDKQLADQNLIAGLITLALNQMGGVSVHDEESGVITINNHLSEWAFKSFEQNEGKNLKNRKSI